MLNIIKNIPYILVLISLINISCENLNSIVMTNTLKNEKDLEHEYLELRDYFGHENLRMDLQQEIIDNKDNDTIFIKSSQVRYINVRITHIPTGKVVFGTSYDNQLENTIEALKKLKAKIKITKVQH